MDALVSTDWLAQHLADDDLAVMDATKHLGTDRDARAEFLAAHIPGALFLDLPTLNDTSADIANALPTREQFASRMRALGIEADTRIVLYDDSDLESAARAWFILRRFGHEQVAILDGGLAKWRREGRDVEQGEADVGSSRYEAEQPQNDVRSKADMLANLASHEEQVVDARDAERFSGASEDAVHGLPGGHIPGARNVFFRSLFKQDGTYKSPDDLRAIFARAGLDIDRPIVASCGSGMTASVVLFALRLAGAHAVSLYDGSWSEWGADPETPKETGAPA